MLGPTVKSSKTIQNGGSSTSTINHKEELLFFDKQMRSSLYEESFKKEPNQQGLRNSYQSALMDYEKGTGSYSPKSLEIFKFIIQSQIRQLEVVSKKSPDETKHDTALDNSSSKQNFGVVVHAKVGASKKVVELREAQQRIATGMYGVFNHKLIHPRRLLMCPVTKIAAIATVHS